MEDKANNLSDAEVVGRVLNGGKDSYRHLVDRYRGPLFSFLYRYTGHREESEDLVQETFFRAYLNLKRYDRSRRFSSWLFTIGHRLAINRWKRLKFKLVDIDEVFDLKDDSPDPLQLVSQRERAAVVEKALNALPDRYRLVITLYYFADQPVADIAAIVGAPMATVKTWLHRGRQLLLQNIDQVKLTGS